MPIKLEKTEQIIFIARKHGVVYLGWWLLSFLFIVAPFFFMFWLFQHGIWGQIGFFASLALGLFILIRTIFLWKKNYAIITTHRVADIDQRGFFDKFVTEIFYDQLDNVSGHIKGFWGTLWRYGIVSIQNGSGKMEIVLEKIKHPVFVQQKINEMRKNFKLKYSEDAICLECKIKKIEPLRAIEEKISQWEINKLLKLKNILDQKIRSLLKSNNDNKQ